MQQIPTEPQFKPDYIYWTRHYLGLFWRWKWYILPTFPLLIVTWLLLVVTFGKIRPELSATVLMGLEKQSTVLVLPETAPNSLGKMKLIQSRNFLNEIVDSLSLHFVLPKYNRSDILTLVKVDSTAIPGKYQFNIDEKSNFTYSVTLSNKALELKKKVITSGRLPSLDTLRTTGMTIAFSPRYLKKPFPFEFFIIPKDKAVENLRGHIAVQGNSRRDPMMEGIVVISHSGTDPQLISTTINTVADKFVERNLSFGKRKTSEVMKALQLQLQAASEQLQQDESRIRAFREANPKVGLGLDAQNAISTITMLESKNMIMSEELEENKALLNRLSGQTGSDNDQTTSEALLLLSSGKIPGAIILQQDFNMHLQKKISLLAERYNPEHPLIKEVQVKMDGIKLKTIQLLKDYIKKQENEIAQTNTQKSLSMSQLQSLPQKEMQLASLMRQQQINSEIYSNILSRYNQSKIADETEIPDIYIMDYSVPPEEASARKELMKLVAIGLIVCVLISFGPAVVVDLFDKRPRSEDDLKRFMPYPLLEIIPVLEAKKEKKGKTDHDSYQQLQVDPKLLEIGPFVTYIHEIFRSLRQKINYRLEAIHGRSYLVTGYDSGEGKSLLAANMAIMAAQQHIPTLIIDGDMRRGVLHNTFGLENQPGLSDLLLSEELINEQILRSTIRATSFPHLFLLTSGFQIDNPTELLTRPRFKGIMQWVHTRFAMVIIDAPPLSPVTDSVIMSNLVSGAVLITRAGKTNTAGLNKVINEFPAFKEKILGVILNGVAAAHKRKAYNAYYYRNKGPKFPSQLLLAGKKDEEKDQEG